MKKKIKYPENVKQENVNNTNENKENTHKPDNNNNNRTEIPPSVEPTDYVSDDVGDITSAADKFVAEERTFEQKLAEMQDKYIRLSAEFDNYRKRTLREKMELSKYAAENLLLKIIPLMDDFERALKLMNTATDCVAMRNGIDLIYGKFSEFLKQNGIKEIESLNNIFNVDLHEAVAKIPVAEGDRKGKVVDVVLKGYYLQDKVLRFSKVVVGE